MSDSQSRFIKGETGTRNHIARLRMLVTKYMREFQKKISQCFIDYSKDLDCMDHEKLWLVQREMGVP